MQKPTEENTRGEGTFEVDGIQFMRPHGNQVPFKTDLPINLEPYYEGMLKNGCRFEAEHLTTGEVSVSISNKDGDIANEIVPNGPEVQEALGKMLRERPWRGFLQAD